MACSDCILDPGSPACPLLQAQVLTLEKEQDTPGESQGHHERVDLKDTVPDGESRTESGMEVSVRGRDVREWWLEVGTPRGKDIM